MSEPIQLNRLARRRLQKINQKENSQLLKVPVRRFTPLDVSGLEYEEGVVVPPLKPEWPWVLEEVTQRKSDNKIITHKRIGMSTAQVSAIRISYAKPEDHFTFRQGKALAIEFNDATTTMKLTRLNQHSGIVTADTIKSVIGEEVETPVSENNTQPNN